MKRRKVADIRKKRGLPRGGCSKECRNLGWVQTEEWGVGSQGPETGGYPAPKGTENQEYRERKIHRQKKA